MRISIGFAYIQGHDGRCKVTNVSEISADMPNGSEDIGTKLVKAIRKTCDDVLAGKFQEASK